MRTGGGQQPRAKLRNHDTPLPHTQQHLVQHLGTIKSSNLCTEIVEYTASDEIAVCNLASVALNMCVR